MKILHFITSLRTGGAERLVCDLTPRLRDMGNEVEVLLMDGTRTPMFSELEGQGIRISALSEGWKAMRNPMALPKLIGFLGRNHFDIVHTHNTSCQILAAVAGIFNNTKLVTTEHNTSNRRRTWAWYRPIDRWMYGRYKAVICVGDETEKALAASVPSVKGKTFTVKNGVVLRDYSTVSPAREIASSEGYTILMVSAFRPQKDHGTLIRAMSLLPRNYTLFLAGGAETDADRKYLEGCRSLVSELGVDGRVRFLGVRSDVPELLKAADVVVMSTHFEGVSLSILEAMSMGKPLVASDVNGVHDMVQGAGVLFPEGNSAALASEIRHLCENPEDAAKTGALCLERANDYDISSTAAGYLKIYSRINKTIIQQ